MIALESFFYLGEDFGATFGHKNSPLALVLCNPYTWSNYSFVDQLRTVAQLRASVPVLRSVGALQPPSQPIWNHRPVCLSTRNLLRRQPS